MRIKGNLIEQAMKQDAESKSGVMDAVVKGELKAMAQQQIDELQALKAFFLASKPADDPSVQAVDRQIASARVTLNRILSTETGDATLTAFAPTASVKPADDKDKEGEKE